MRKLHTAELKAKVALEAVKGLKLVNEIASHYEVSPTQVSTWKKHFLECSVDTFKSVKDKKANQNQAQVDNLYLSNPSTGQELYDGLADYFNTYNRERLHQSLSYMTPESIYLAA